MKSEDVRIGMKVVAHNKTVGCKGLKNSPNWVRAIKINQPFLYVVDGYNNTQEWILSDKLNCIAIGDYFYAEDFEVYRENKMKDKAKEIVLKLTLEDEATKISHTYKDWNFTEAEPETIHAYVDAIVDLLKAFSFSEEVIADGFKEWVEDRESEIY